MIKSIQAARYLLAKRRPYLASAIWSMTVIETEALDTAGIDARWKLYLNPQAVSRWKPEAFADILYHLVLHLLRGHPERMKLFPEEIGTIAADLEINDDLWKENVHLPEPIVLPKHFNLPDGKLAEWYARKLLEQAIPIELEKRGYGGNCGSGASGHEAPWEEPGGWGEEGISPEAGKAIRRIVAQSILEHQKSQGYLPAHLQRWAEDILESKVDWRKELPNLVRAYVAQRAGAIDFTWQRPSHRSQITRVILPTLRGGIPRVSIVIDTSGSMDSQDLRTCLSEVSGIIRAVGGKVHVLVADAEVHWVGEVFNPKEIELIGGGGTSMKVAIEEAIESRPDCIIVLTDGYTDWPQSSDVPVIAGMITKPDASPPPTPDWMKRLEIVYD